MIKKGSKLTVDQQYGYNLFANKSSCTAMFVVQIVLKVVTCSSASTTTLLKTGSVQGLDVKSIGKNQLQFGSGQCGQHTNVLARLKTI